MATHSSVLAWRIHGQRSLRELQSTARSRTRLSDFHISPKTNPEQSATQLGNQRGPHRDPPSLRLALSRHWARLTAQPARSPQAGGGYGQHPDRGPARSALFSALIPQTEDDTTVSPSFKWLLHVLVDTGNR